MNNLHYTDKVLFQKFQHLDIQIVPERRAVWLYFNSVPLPCFTLTLLQELNNFQETLRNYNGKLPYQGQLIDIDYSVVTSHYQVFSLGGDLNLFLSCINNNDREALRSYAKYCVNAVYDNYNGRDFDITTIILARGSALGGGFEAAMSAHVLVAEHSTEFGLPETLFNLFPGMGAYNFLSQKLGTVMAEKMILSGNLYSAEELYEMGIVDILVEDGQGKAAVNDYIAKSSQRKNSIDAVRKVRQLSNPIDYQELLDIADIWVDAAFNLSHKDIRLMRRLVKAQNKFIVTEDNIMDAAMMVESL